ncbi:hypothetical protein MKX01_004583 [Papaver californicum]|nr:hypothetical protein MKX01_004583 [Papaver californicum]
MFLIFLTIRFIGITSGFLIGYMTGIIGVIFGTGYRNNFSPDTDNHDHVDFYSICSSLVPGILYLSGFWGIDIRKQSFSRLDMRRHMIFSGALVAMGSVITALTTNIYIKIMNIGLNLFAFGIILYGAQVYMSEMGFAHRNYLASLNIAFKMMISIGILVANLVNSSTNSIKGGWGWELSIVDDAKQLLQGLHGTNDDVHILFKDLLAANEASKTAKECEKKIMSQTQNRPYRVMAIALPLFQQLTGMDVIVLYAPYLFQVVGFEVSAALKYTAILGEVNVAATIIGIISVSRGCRRFFLVAGGIQIVVGQIMLAILTLIKLGGATGPSDVYDYLIIATTCICVAGFAWSWGPLGWIFLSSCDDMLLLYPLEVRSCGQNLASKVHWLFSGFITYLFPFMVCQFKFYVLYLFAFFEDVSKVWKQHLFWRRYFVDLDTDMMV